MTPKEAAQVIYDEMMGEIRPCSGQAWNTPPEAVFPQSVLSALHVLANEFQLDTTAYLSHQKNYPE